MTSFRRIAVAMLTPLLLVRIAPVAGASSQPDPAPVVYRVSLREPQTQMVDISIDVAAVNDDALDFVMPSWRPGRYQILDQASVVREVRAFDGAGRKLEVEQVNKSAWRVRAAGAQSVSFHYRLYANALGERTRHVDDTHAFLSGAAVFMMVEDRREHPTHVVLEAPESWVIASGLAQSPGQGRTLVAPNYDVLVDSPIEIGVHESLHFTAAGKPHQIALWAPAMTLQFDRDKLTADIAAIIEAEAEIFGRVPYERYVFITHIGAGAGGGTEHLNSTVVQGARKALEDDDGYRGFMSLVAHEVFHAWNVKQFRPSGIHPYDYQRENYTRLLWVAEGTTSYYDDMIPVRAGVSKPDKYLDIVSGVIDAMRRKPGELVQSLEESSFNAWTQFHRAWPDEVNATVNFYSKGALVSLLLDMEIRKRTGNAASLDQVMRTLFERFPLDGPGYTPEDFQRAAEEAAGGPLDEFFTMYVAGASPLPLEQAVGVVGLELIFKPAKDDDDDNSDGSDEENQTDAQTGDTAAASQPDAAPVKAYLGMNLRDDGGRAIVASILSDGPAYAAGIMAGDQVLAIDGQRLVASELDPRLEALEPGQPIELTIFRHDQLRTVRLTLGEIPDGTWKLRRVKSPTDVQRAAYESWLGQPWPDN